MSNKVFIYIIKKKENKFCTYIPKISNIATYYELNYKYRTI